VKAGRGEAKVCHWGQADPDIFLKNKERELRTVHDCYIFVDLFLKHECGESFSPTGKEIDCLAEMAES
jgi:hypothetical protein